MMTDEPNAAECKQIALQIKDIEVYSTEELSLICDAIRAAIFNRAGKQDPKGDHIDAFRQWEGVSVDCLTTDTTDLEKN